MSLTASLFGGGASAAVAEVESPVASTKKIEIVDEAPDVFATNKKRDDLFQVANSSRKESRREKQVREATERIENAKNPKGKIDMHKVLNKKHLSHAVDKHDEEDVRTVFVGNLPNNIQRKTISNFFADCGEIENTRIRCQAVKEQEVDKPKKGRAIQILKKEFKEGEEYSAVAYVLFEKESSVAKAIEKTGFVLLDRHISVNEESKLSKAFDHKTSGFLGNIAYDTSDEAIWRYFIDRNITEIKRVRLVRDRETGLAKGFGYIEFASQNVLEKAIALRGEKLNGRELRMCHVQKSKDPAVAKLQASRRDKRKDDNKNARKAGPDRKGAKKQKPYDHNKQQTEKKPRVEDAEPWMGTTTNPRKKLARDLRPLIPSNVVLSKEKKKALTRKAGGGGGGKKAHPGAPKK